MDAEGRVQIVDRKKDMISVSGFKVFPNEVEDVAMSQGGLMECALVGVPDEHSGEVGKLFVVKKNPDVTAADLAVFSRFTSRELQSTEIHRVPRRTSQDQRRQDPQARPSRRSQPTFRALT